MSVMTASRAINSPAMVSEHTREAVLQAVRSMGYVPNLHAAGLKSKRTRLIACLVPTIASGSAFLQALQSMTGAFVERGYQVMLYERGYDRTRDDAVIEATLSRRPDGVALLGAIRTRTAREMLRKSGIPVIETWDMTETPVDMIVGFSHLEVGRAVARYLHQRGKRCVTAINSTESRTGARFSGFADEAMRLGIAGRELTGGSALVMDSPSGLRWGRQALSRALVSEPHLDAIFAVTDMVAMGVLVEAQVRHIEVPRKLSVVGFGDFDFSGDIVPSLTTVRVDNGRIGERAAQMLVDKIEGRAVDASMQDVGFSIIERESS